MPFSIQYVYYFDKVSELVRLAFNMTKSRYNFKKKRFHTQLSLSQREFTKLSSGITSSRNVTFVQPNLVNQITVF